MIKELYQELRHQRESDIEQVRHNIAKEIKESRKLKRHVVRERQQQDNEAVAGLDPVALDMEEQVSCYAIATSLLHILT